MKTSLLSLLLICFGVLTFAKSPRPQINKFSYIIDTLTRPYSDAYSHFRNKTESGYKSLQSMLLSGLTGSSASDDSRSSRKRAPIVAQDNTLNIANTDIDDQESNESSRMLQSSCSHGASASTQIRIYTCGGTEVTKTAYQALNGQGCTVTTDTRSLCYCPYDYYGDRCESVNPFTCEIQRINYPATCQGVDGYAYVYSYSGVPPCNTVQAGETINFRTKAICTPVNTQYNFEGVKPSKYEVITQPTAPATFTYAISSDSVHATNLPTVTQKIAFTNWKKMTSPISYSSSALTAGQLAGAAEISISVPFQYPLTQAATVGRYYFELSMTTSSGSPSFSTTGYSGGYFEQAGYQEPAAPKKASKVLVIVLPILGGVLLIGLVVGYKIFQKRKERRERLEASESAPLVAEE